MIWLKFFLITIILELFTGTIYLLFISFAFLITFILYFFKISTNFNYNLIINSILIIISIICAYYFNKNQSSKNEFSNLGDLVTIEKIQENGFIYVKYRGVLWQAIMKNENLNDNLLKGKKAEIINQQGNILEIKLI